MPATVIAERVGWDRGIGVFKQRVAELRPAYLPLDPASRTSYVAGDQGQLTSLAGLGRSGVTTSRMGRASARWSLLISQVGGATAQRADRKCGST